MLSEKELNRYKHHLKLPSFGFNAQEKLKKSKVLIVGMGGLGCPAAQYLAAAGIGTLGIIDGDVVEESNLQRQVLYTEKDIQTPKVEAARKRLKASNPHLKIKNYNFYLENYNALDIVKEFDVIVDATDNFSSRYLINDSCYILKKPYVFGSVMEFDGQLSVFNYQKGPTYRCIFPCPPDNSSSCGEIGVLGVVPGIIGTLQACEVIKIITGIGEVLSGKLLLWNGLTMQSRIFSFNKNIDVNRHDSQLYLTQTCSTKERPISSSSAWWKRTITSDTRVKIITQEDFLKLIKNGEEFQLIDVRDEKEIKNDPKDFYHMKIKHWPIDSMYNNKHSETTLNTTIKTIVMCKSGIRSQEAAWILEQKFGYTEVYSLQKGFFKGLFQVLKEIEAAAKPTQEVISETVHS